MCRVVRAYVYEQILQLYPDEGHQKKEKKFVAIRAIQTSTTRPCLVEVEKKKHENFPMCLVQPNTSKLRELLRAHSLEGQRRHVREQAAALCGSGREGA